MQKSESIKALSAALTAVQKEIKPALKEAENPFFKSKYADLNSVWDSCRDLLGKNGLSVAQGNSVGLDNTVIVETLLMHSSGEWIQSELCLPLSKHDPQGVGSAVTYGRRYGLSAIVGIVADVDDDGNAASGKNGSTKLPLRPETPTEREGLLLAIKTIGQALNKSGDSIKWSGKTSNEYTQAQFGDDVTLETANVAQLKTIAEDLKGRLKTLKEAA